MGLFPGPFPQELSRFSNPSGRKSIREIHQTENSFFPWPMPPFFGTGAFFFFLCSDFHVSFWSFWRFPVFPAEREKLGGVFSSGESPRKTRSKAANLVRSPSWKIFLHPVSLGRGGCSLFPIAGFLFSLWSGKPPIRPPSSALLPLPSGGFQRLSPKFSVREWTGLESFSECVMTFTQ